MGEKVIAVDEADHVTSDVPNALVQGVVDPVVWLANQPHPIMASTLNGSQRAIL